MQSTVVDHIDLISLLFFIVIHYFLLFPSLSLFAFLLWKDGTHLVVKLLWTVRCVSYIFIFLYLEKWYAFSALLQFIVQNVLPFIQSFNINFSLCCFIPLGFSLICDTAFGIQHTKFLGGMCDLVVLGWSVGDLKITRKVTITPVTRLILMWNN